MLRFFALCVIFSSFFTILKADDRGFRFTPSFTGLVGLVDGKISMKTAIQGELTYVMFNQWEFGFGSGYHRQHLTQSSEETFYISQDEIKTFTIPRFKADSMPYYAILRYNFDLFEDGYLVTAIKYGSYILTPGDKHGGGGLPSSSDNPDVPADILKFENDFSRIKFLAVTVGYDISNTVISLEYRRVRFNQDLSYINETKSQTISHSSKSTNHYIGINMAYKIDLF